MEIKHHNTLPKQFGSWLQVYRHFKKVGFNFGDKLVFEYVDEHDFHKYTFSIPYIKEMCFDELQTDTFTIEDLRTLQMALHSYGHFEYDKDLVNKISSLMHVKYEFKDV